MNGFPTTAVRRLPAALLLLAGVVWAVGCGKPDAHFALNGVQLVLTEESYGFQPEEKDEILQTMEQQVSDALEAMLGTPDEPHLPAGLPAEVAGLLDMRRLEQAAGPVVTDEAGLTVSGLYRQHCGHCHGLSGGGDGPTAPFLNPYPRDYRPGIFKFKSTPIGVKPTDEDLHRILIEGIAGTAMPSFRLLPGKEIDALVEYVKYLSIRGQVEQKLIEEAALGELEPEYMLDVLVSTMNSWLGTQESVAAIPPPSDEFDWDHAADRGEALYYSTQANCFSCHGPTQLGDGQRGNYDSWTEAWAVTQSGTLKAEDKLKPFLEVGALPPRPITPRNLRQGVFRFGRRPVDIYRRILNGIEGTPMPASNPSAVSSDDIWYLVYFVRSLQYRPLSEPQHYDMENLRERM